MKHITPSPYDPQTNGKLERYHRTAKARVNLFVYHRAAELSEGTESFVNYYNYQRFHEALGNVTPAKVYYGRRELILTRRIEHKKTPGAYPGVFHIGIDRRADRRQGQFSYGW